MISPNLTIEEIVGHTKDLPSIPAAALAVMREVERSESSAMSVAKILVQDQALSARVLRLANSAYYGLSRQVGDLQEAVVILGMRSVRNLALVAGTYPWLSKEIKGYALGPKAMWTHSLGVAVGAQMCARASKKADPETSFMSGLLHNLGKVVLAIWLESRLLAILETANSEGITFDEAERRFLGFDHCDVGAHLAEKWNLPEGFQLAMQYHHAPDLCTPHNPLVDCVHIGDYLTMSFGLGLGGDGLRYEISSNSLERLGFSVEMYEKVASEFLEEFVRYEEMFDTILSGG